MFANTSEVSSQKAMNADVYGSERLVVQDALPFDAHGTLLKASISSGNASFVLPDPNMCICYYCTGR